jgi:hypothetical protein
VVASVKLNDKEPRELEVDLKKKSRSADGLGQLLIEARNSSRRSRIPNWFIETLTASTGQRTGDAVDLAGLKGGSEYRYGFVHLGGARNRVDIHAIAAITPGPGSHTPIP